MTDSKAYSQFTYDHFLDTSGLVCPLPVLKARKLILSLKAGETILIRMTDSDAPDDIKALCRKLKANVLSLVDLDETNAETNAAWLMLVAI